MSGSRPQEPTKSRRSAPTTSPKSNRFGDRPAGGSPAGRALRPQRASARAAQAAQLRLDLVEPAAEQGASPARIDQVVDAEVLGAREDRLRARDLLLELAAARLGVRGGRDLATEGECHAALDGKRTRLGGGPGDDGREAAEVD